MFEKYLAPLESELRAIVPEGGEAGPLYTMLRYHLGWVDPAGRPSGLPSGKRIRPLLCLLACEGYGADFHRALPAAAALELLHNFTLIHDDIQDRSDERRHRPTVWRIWGEAQGIDAGDAMYALARLALLRLPERGVPVATVLAAVALFDRACLNICEGQYLDIDFERRAEVGQAEYLAMIGRKTAALIGAAAEMGALVAGATPSQREAMRQFGETLGLAYQVQDDILGVWGDPRVTGKPAADDIRSKKKTLLVVHALAHGDARQVETLRRVYGQASPTEAEVAEIMQILEETGARGYAEAEAGRLYGRTIDWLDVAAPAAPVKAALGSLVRSLLQRPS